MITLFIIEKRAQRYMFNMALPNILAFIFYDSSKMKEMKIEYPSIFMVVHVTWKTHILITDPLFPQKISSLISCVSNKNAPPLWSRKKDFVHKNYPDPN